MPSTPDAYPQVISRTFALFRVLKFDVSAGQQDFWAGIDSRQLHRKQQFRGCKSRPELFSPHFAPPDRGDDGEARTELPGLSLKGMSSRMSQVFTISA